MHWEIVQSSKKIVQFHQKGFGISGMHKAVISKKWFYDLKPRINYYIQTSGHEVQHISVCNATPFQSPITTASPI